MSAPRRRERAHIEAEEVQRLGPVEIGRDGQAVELEHGADAGDRDGRVVRLVQEVGEAEDERGRERERTAERRQTGDEQTLDALERDAGEDDLAERVETTTTRATGGLTEVERRQEGRVAGEDDRTRGLSRQTCSSSARRTMFTPSASVPVAMTTRRWPTRNSVSTAVR